MLDSQTPRASKYELIWAMGHPIAAIKIHWISKKCDPIYNGYAGDKRLDAFNLGGKLDAYRHVFYTAAFAQHVKMKKVQKLGIAHEKNNYARFLRSQTEHAALPDSLSGVMDLKNNEIGIAIGQLHKKISLASLSEIVITEISKGNATILKRNSYGVLVTCTNEPIDRNNYKNTWAVAFCLIRSSEVK